MEPSQKDVIVLRIAEIFLKGDNRHKFFRRFIQQAKRLLDDIPGVTVESHYLRGIVRHPPARREHCIRRLKRLFGLSSMSPAQCVAKDIEAISQTALSQASELPATTTFKIETNRRDKRFPIRSMEVSRTIGAKIVEQFGLPVNVHHPDATIAIEIGPEECFVFQQRIPGPGGLPVGVSGSVSLLLSGGIDSPVAGWSAMRRGCRIHAVYFHSFPYTGDKTKQKVLALAEILAKWQGQLVVHVVPFTNVQKQLRETGTGDLAVVLYRRMMMRVAGRLAQSERCSALVTGENLGQVASQTLTNLGVIEDAAPLPVLRPLITNDKLEIIQSAQTIGTYDTSILPYDDCCSLFVPKHPATRARMQQIQRCEAKLDVNALAGQLAEQAERHLVGRAANRDAPPVEDFPT